MASTTNNVVNLGDPRIEDKDIKYIIIALFWVFVVPALTFFTYIENGLSWAGIGLYAAAFYGAQKKYFQTYSGFWNGMLYIVCLVGPLVVISFCLNAFWVQWLINFFRTI